MPLDIEQLEPTTRNDYRRANGAPMVMVDGKNERYSRPSSFAKPLDDESALNNWKLDRACIGVAYDRALQAAFVAVAEGDRDGLAALREKAINAGRGAEKADIGTALHAMSVRWEQKEAGFWPPEPFLSSLIAYDEQMRRLDLYSALYEYHVVNREYRCAGTADRLYEVHSPLVTPDGSVLPVGTMIVGDLKTGEKLEYSKAAYAVQLALYASGDFYNVLTDEFMTEPPYDGMRQVINQQWGIIVHMPADQPGRCEFLWIDLEVGRYGCYLVQQVKLWRKMWRSGEYDLPEVQLDTNLVRSFDGYEIEDPHVIDYPRAGLQRATVDVATILDAPSPDVATSVDDGALLEAHVAWARERIAQIANHDGAKLALMCRWPEGLPTPKQQPNSEQVMQIHTLLDMIEADYELSFVPKPAAILGTGPTRRKRK